MEHLPKEYIDFISRPDRQDILDDLCLYQIDEIYERNEELETGKYAPGYVAIGDDGGDAVFLMSLDRLVQIYRVDAGI